MVMTNAPSIALSRTLPQDYSYIPGQLRATQAPVRFMQTQTLATLGMRRQYHPPPPQTLNRLG
jgi:hypothetical protein